MVTTPTIEYMTCWPCVGNTRNVKHCVYHWYLGWRISENTNTWEHTRFKLSQLTRRHNSNNLFLVNEKWQTITMTNNNNCDFSNDFLLKGEIYEIHHEANACFYFTYNKKLVCSVKIAVVNSAKAFSGSAKKLCDACVW